jgi:hypothetical protein
MVFRGSRFGITICALLMGAAVVALVLAGCSGGHGPTLPSPDEPGVDQPDGPDGPDDPGDQPDGPDDGELSTEETVAAVEEYGEAYVAMLNEGMTIPEAIAEAAALMQADSAFSAVEIDGTGYIVWAEFTNGWPYAIIGNRPPVAEEVADDRADDALADAEQLRPAAAEELPDATSAVIMNGFGAYRPGTVAGNNEIDQMLSNRGYQTNQMAVTTTNLMNLGAPGVLMINSHGAAPDETTIGRPALWLDEAITQALADTYAARGWNENDYLTMLSTSEDDPNSGDSVNVQNFAVTDAFIANEVSVGANSVVFSQSCSSGVEMMHDAWLGAGAGIYVGWSDWCSGTVPPRFFFDRMTAANQFRPETPDQRPFDWQFVLTDMRDRGLDTTTIDPGLFGGLAGGVLNRIAILNVFTRDDTGILAPTIRYLEMDEPNDELIVHGVFGSRQGEVTVDGVNAGISSWNATEIRATIPRQGPGSEGPVEVSVDGRESNEANLTSWRQQFDFTFKPDLGSLMVEFDIDAHFRGDVREWRRQAAGDPMHNEPFRFEAAQDTEGTWEASGEHTRTNPLGEVVTTKFVGTGDIALLNAGSIGTAGAQPAQLGEGMRIYGQIRPEEHRIRTHIAATVQVTAEEYRDGEFTGSIGTPVILPSVLPQYIDGTFPNGLAYIEMQMGNNYNIGSGEKRIAADGTLQLLEWGITTAQFPPDEDHER